MKHDIYEACVALVMSRTSGPLAGRGPRPSALGWKLERDLMAVDVEVLHASIRGALTGAAVPRRWANSTWLRALLKEYRDVRRGNASPRARLVVARRRSGDRPGQSPRTGRVDCDS